MHLIFSYAHMSYMIQQFIKSHVQWLHQMHILHVKYMNITGDHLFIVRENVHIQCQIIPNMSHHINTVPRVVLHCTTGLMFTGACQEANCLSDQPPSAYRSTIDVAAAWVPLGQHSCMAVHALVISIKVIYILSLT